MGYRASLDRVKAAFDDVAAAAGVAGKVTWAYGQQSLHSFDAPPRIVWVPTTGKFEPNSKSTNVLPNALPMRALTVAAHVWGVSEDACEEMLNAIAIALRASYGSAGATLIGESWLDGEPAAKSNNGVLMVVLVKLLVPLQQLPNGTVLIQGMDITQAIDPPGGSSP